MRSRFQISRQTQTETHRNTYTRVCVEDACAACGAANVGATLGGNIAYTAASQKENFVVFSGTIWLLQRSQRRRRKAGKAKGEWGNPKPRKRRRFF